MQPDVTRSTDALSDTATSCVLFAYYSYFLLHVQLYRYYDSSSADYIISTRLLRKKGLQLMNE